MITASNITKYTYYIKKYILLNQTSVILMLFEYIIVFINIWIGFFIFSVLILIFLCLYYFYFHFIYFISVLVVFSHLVPMRTQRLCAAAARQLRPVSIEIYVKTG